MLNPWIPALVRPPSLALIRILERAKQALTLDLLRHHPVFPSLARFPLVFCFYQTDCLHAGIYLSQLRRLNKLPAVIDPTAPNSLLRVDPITATFDPLAHPDVFSTLNPLPPSMHLEPLINVHKQRRVAEVIKSLVAGQHLASRVHLDVDRKLFQKCLRLRGLDVVYLQRALDIYPD